uniref:(California timema) hypothetical protein n=1 Tax=Timema californicum TaxID=61474 RepID=A0A7R9JG07_TIMCA|nr:unnamed protein product [Timema californicum]
MDKLCIVELIQKYGYQAEIHHVTSPDGYVTTLHRLPPRGRITRSTPILLQHGLLGSSADWVLIGPRDGLGYNLVDAGYDVWLGNNRGNSYSRKHVNLTTSNKKYWDFSMHEMGVHDTPAVIDYILGRALSTELYYIGHSLGASLFFIMTSEKPEYNSKVRAMIGLAPGAFLGNARSPIVVPWFKALAKLQVCISQELLGLCRSRATG